MKEVTTPPQQPFHKRSGGRTSESEAETTSQAVSSHNKSNRIMRCNSWSDEDDNESSFQDAVAASSALVGESILDSPQQARRQRISTVLLSEHHQKVSHFFAAEILGAPVFTHDDGTPRGATSSTQSSSTAAAAEDGSDRLPPLGPQRTVATRRENDNPLGVLSSSSSSSPLAAFSPPPPLATDNASAVSVGIMAQGLAWARRQRERRKRLYLQNQAEQQMLKITRQAEQEQRVGGGVVSALMDSYIPTSFSSLLFSTSSNNDNTDLTGGGDAPDIGWSDNHNQHIHNNTGTNTYLEYHHDRGEAIIDISKSGDGISMVLPSYAVNKEDEQQQQQQQQQHDDCDNDDDSYIPPVRLLDESEHGNNEDDDQDDAPARSSSSVGDTTTAAGTTTNTNPPYLLTRNQMQQIAIHVLPRGIAYCKWKRLYSLARDGDSFESFLDKLKCEARTLMVLRTTRNAVFGAYADAAWEPHMQGGASYYGSANACLFKVEQVVGTTTHPDSSSTHAEEQGSNGNDDYGTDDDDDDDQTERRTVVKAYHWSGENRYVQLCDPSHKMLAFGGGGDDGAFGLCVEEDFQKGSTGPCATFANEPLCDQENFQIVDMEVYGFMVGQF